MADSPTRPTPAPWIWELDDDGITDPTAEVFVDDDRPWRIVIAFVAHQPQLEANAALIVAACNACQQLANEFKCEPQAIATALVDLVLAAKDALRQAEKSMNKDFDKSFLRAALASIETQETR